MKKEKDKKRVRQIATRIVCGCWRNECVAACGAMLSSALYSVQTLKKEQK